jgi:hypothetical protein
MRSLQSSLFLIRPIRIGRFGFSVERSFALCPYSHHCTSFASFHWLGIRIYLWSREEKNV